MIAWRRCATCLRPHDPAAACGATLGVLATNEQPGAADAVAGEAGAVAAVTDKRRVTDKQAVSVTPLTPAQRQAAYRARKGAAAKTADTKRKAAKRAAKGK